MLAFLLLLAVVLIVLGPTRAAADASLVSVRYKAQSAFGTPATGTFQEIRLASEDLGQDKEVTSSDEIISDRTNPDNIQVGSSGSGPIVTEAIGGNTTTGGLSNAYPEDFYAYSLGQVAATFAGQGTSSVFSSGTMAVDNVTAGGELNRITFTHSATTFQAGFTAGSLVLVQGFLADNATNSLTYLNAAYQVVSGAGTTALVCTAGPRVTTAAPPRTTPTLNAATAITFSKYGTLTNGTTLTPVSIERKYGPIAGEFARLADFHLDGFEFDMQPKKPARVTWNWIGKEEISATNTMTSAVNAAPTNKSLSPVADMKSFAVGEDGHSFQIISFKLKVSGGLYLQDEEAGTLGPVGVGVGTFKVEGSCTFYYEGVTSSSLFDFYRNFTDKRILFCMGNANADGIAFNLPRCNFKDGRRSTPGKDQAHKGRLDFVAARGSDPLIASPTAFLMQIGRR